MADDQEKEAGEGGQEKPKSKKKLFIILGLVVLLLGAGVPAALMLTGEEEVEQEQEALEDEIKLASFQLEPFVVNLSKSTSFLKAIIVVEYDEVILDAEMQAKGSNKIMAEKPDDSALASGDNNVPDGLVERVHHMKDAVITILSGKTHEQVLSTEGKEDLKDELVEALNDASALDEGPIVAVYFLEFIVQ